MNAGYKLRTTLEGHAGDVRALCTARVGSSSADEAIISGSRDKTVLVWSEEGRKFAMKTCLKGHEKYVSSVAWLPASSKYPKGLILTGSHDTHVRVFNPLGHNPTQPEYTLSGHKDAVVSIAANKDGTVLTGSWDGTGKLWQDSFCVATLEGHEMAVWAVEFVRGGGGDGQNLLASGSADKTVRIWDRTGKSLRTLKGHTDVVRGLVSPRPNQLLSCANDASIRHWDVASGSCLKTHFGHTNYIYAIALLGPNGFVTSSEDASLRVWDLDNAEALQTIRIPARSVWAVTALSNGDIVAGGSDSRIRIFTRDGHRYASADEEKAYEEELSATAFASKEVLEGIKNEDLPTEAALLAPGVKDGQTKIIRRGNAVEVYNWSAIQQQWQKVGDVIGSAGDKAASEKTIHNGREYDYVFTVDFDESKPPVKLPYNLSDDPWTVAQRFLEDNELPPGYLETVAKFILKNAPGAEASVHSASSEYQDPFTGAGRYMPAGARVNGAEAHRPAGGGAGGGGGGGVNFDPFTGGSSYSTALGSRGTQQTQAAPVNDLYPVKEFVGFHAGNVDGLLKKLRETLENEGMEWPEDAAAQLMPYMQKDVTPIRPSVELLNFLGKTLDLSEGVIFPALDLLRLAIRHPAVCEYFCGPERAGFFLDFLVPLVRSPRSNANQQLSLRLICNVFLAGSSGQSFVFEHRKGLLTAVSESVAGVDKNVQTARASVLLNYAVLLGQKRHGEEMMQLLYGAAELGKVKGAVEDDEARYRWLVCMGTLLAVGGQELKEYGKVLDLMGVCETVAGHSKDERVQSALRHLRRDLR